MGGVAKKLTGAVTGLLGIEKPDTSAQDAAVAEQAALLAKQEKDLTTKETEREERMKRKRQGKRSLLYSESDELGVTKSNTLGG